MNQINALHEVDFQHVLSDLQVVYFIYFQEIVEYVFEM